MDWIGLFYSPIRWFVGHPLRILTVALLFLVLSGIVTISRKGQAWPLLWATGVWLTFSLWEWLMVRQEANIRIDLFFIYPVMLFISLWALGRSFLWLRRLP